MLVECGPSTSRAQPPTASATTTTTNNNNHYNNNTTTRPTRTPRSAVGEQWRTTAPDLFQPRTPLAGRPRPRSALRPTSAPHPLALCLALGLLSQVVDARAAVSSKCYFFGPGTTIHGSDYRREHDVSRKECAESCKADLSCMGFEFLEGRCTLKSRSLNGTITSKADAYFGLCLDFDDPDRDRFWDHELGGTALLTKEKTSREKCSQLCAFQEEAIIYSWQAEDERQPEGQGRCECIGVLHSIRLSFGSAAGFLV